MFDTYTTPFNTSKIAAAQAAQGAGADGRTVLQGSNLLSLANPIRLSNFVNGSSQSEGAGDLSAQYQNPGASGDFPAAYAPGTGDQAAAVNPVTSYSRGQYTDGSGNTVWAGLGLNDGNYLGTGDAQARYQAQQTALAQQLGLDPNGQYATTAYDNPTGNGQKDQAVIIYKVNADGSATPVSAQNSYNPSEWVNNGRDVAKYAAAVVGGGFGLGALAGAAGGAAGAGAAGEAGAAGSAGLSSADTAALFGDAGYGATGAGASGALPTVGNAAGLTLGGAGADSAGAQAGAWFGSNAAADAGGALGGGTSIGSSLGIDGFGSGLGTATAGAGVTGGLADAGALGAAGSSALGSAVSNPSLWSSVGDYLTSNSGLKTLGSLGSTALQAYQSSNALKAQTDATNNANALSKYIYDTNRADNAPLLATRNTALTGLNSLMSNPSSISSDPGYQFGLSQGVQGIDRSAASRGGLYSGATLKALDRYSTDYGQTKLSDSFNRLSSAAGLGATATNSNTQSGANYANTVGNNTTGLGNAAAGNALYNGNIYSNLLNGAVSTYTNSKPGG